jgi:hypothetical protein
MVVSTEVFGIRKFRATPGYQADVMVVYAIPATEDWLIPVGAEGLGDGSWRFVVRVGYAFGDVSFARQHALAVLADHPTWTAHLYRVTGEYIGALLQEVPANG